jgi:hypothetical protein
VNVASLLLDGSAFEWPAVASGALVIFLGGLFLFIAKRRLHRDDKLEGKEKAALAAELAARVGLHIEAECEKLRFLITEETRNRSVGEARLGDDIVTIQNTMCHDYGERGKPLPTFRRRSSGDD